MRWLIDARPLADPAQGGVSRVTRGLLEAFISLEKKDEIALATTGAKKPCLNLPHDAACRHFHFHVPNKLWSIGAIAGIIALDREAERRIGKIDAAFLPNLGFVGARQSRPYVLLLHDLSFLIEPRWFSLKTRLWHKAVNAKRLIRRAAHLLAVSEKTKRDAIRLLNIPAERITVIPIGQTLNFSDIPPSSFHLPHSSKYILAMGGNDPRKNIRTAIAAVEELNRAPVFADIHLIIIGRDIIRPSDNELASLYRNAAAFLYPSWYEGYGLPLHEAAQFGTPCIASTAGALPETAPAGTIFADPAKPHHWVEALRIVLSSPRPNPPQLDPQAWQKAAEILRDKLDCIVK
ncbi:glycosyltransferase family 4 protein [Patescibacteria group bacterium]|nr:glycosyltransferase family 4 protein [Patescibacteria group bacterium]MBU1034544.1 glycosyltransferase family 4 protein [Patescibacteria group bacterium]MBU1629728.1 glycosyltransferase family 4 protein [Patescibacteria group bacterium]MBU1907554.1 glycosyltransferase family 4 protein [Patescibacteria group bacterium]